MIVVRLFKNVFLSYEKTGIFAAVDSLEKNFGVAMSNMKRALARFRAFFPVLQQAKPLASRTQSTM